MEERKHRPTTEGSRRMRETQQWYDCVNKGILRADEGL